MRGHDGKFAPGAMVFFTLKGNEEESKTRGVRLCDYIAENSYVLTLAVSLGQIRTLVEHPAGMTHYAVPPEAQRAQGIEPGGVRMSAGIEPFTDIRADLEEALDAV
jgi:cystathionine beta-lyase/cystathionine gamma-synthase